MKRKFKEGYYCTFDGFLSGRKAVYTGSATHPINLKHIADSNFTKDQAGDDIIDIRFYSPEHKKVTMEEATEIVKVKKEGWVNVFRGENPKQIGYTIGIFATKELANEYACDRVDCVKIEWEEEG